MKKISSIFTMAVLTLVALLSPVPLVSAEETLTETWGPQDRESFTWEKPASYVTFNSITDNPTLGSEKNFVRVREAGTDNLFDDEVTIEAGKEYEVYIYYHNNASANLNESGAGIAQNVMLKSNFPTKLTSGDVGVIKGTISASNATPTSVWDTAFLRSDKTLYLSYVPGSAIIHNSGSADGKNIDPESMFNDGALLAYDNNYWGIIPGCNEYAGYATYRIKVDVPDFWMEKTVSRQGVEEYGETITVSPGEMLDFKILYQNTGTSEQTAVTVHDEMPSGLTYVSGTTFVTSPEAKNGIYVEDKLLSDEGLVIGNFYGGEEATIKYRAQVGTNFPCGETTLYNNVYVVTANGTEYDKAKIVVNRVCADTSTLPTTGPGEIAMAIAIVVVITGGVFYLYHSQKLLRKVSSAVSGEDNKDLVIDGIQNNKTEE